MTPVAFKGANIIMGAQQAQDYEPLPAHKSPEGVITTCWLPSDAERKALAEGAPIFLMIHTFNHPLQPVLLQVGENSDQQPGT